MARDTRNNEQLRVYAPANGSLAFNENEYAYRTTRLSAQPKRREAEPAVRPGHKRRPVSVQRPNLLHMIRANRAIPKFAALICLAAVAAVAAFAVIRYFNIASLQSDINAVNSQIKEEQRMIDDLTSSSKPVINATEFADQVGLIPARPY